jgi:phage tail-like protein
VHGIASAHPIGPLLPAMLVEDEFAQRFVGGIDDVLAPIISTIDNVPAYLNPLLAPPDFLEWLAHWVGVAMDSNVPLARRRAIVASASDVYAWRGTARGLAEAVEAATGIAPEIRDPGGVAFSTVPGAQDGATKSAPLVVILRAPDPGAIDRAHIDALVRAAVPAHVPVTLEVLQS